MSTKARRVLKFIALLPLAPMIGVGFMMPENNLGDMCRMCGGGLFCKCNAHAKAMISWLNK